VNLGSAIAAVDLQRQFSRELNEIVAAAGEIFRTVPLPEAKTRILDLIPKFPTYHRFFQRQIAGQHPPTVLEAKLSHDLAYYRYFDRIAALSEKTAGLGILISELKKLPHDARQEDLERYLDRLERGQG
jgi:hypothetical protein